MPGNERNPVNRSNRSNPKRLLNKLSAAEKRKAEAAARVAASTQHIEALIAELDNLKKQEAAAKQGLALAQKRLALLQATSSAFQVIDLTDQSEEDPN